MKRFLLAVTAILGLAGPALAQVPPGAQPIQTFPLFLNACPNASNLQIAGTGFNIDCSGGFSGGGTGSLITSPNISWSGTGTNYVAQSFGTPDLSAMWIAENLTGTFTFTPDFFYLSENALNVTDNLVSPNSGVIADTLAVNDIVGASSVGSKTALHPGVWVNTKPADNSPGTGQPTYTGIYPHVQATVNVGGTGTSDGTAAGQMIASNPNVYLDGTNWFTEAGEIISLTAQTGSSLANKVGLEIEEGANDTVQGAVSDTGLLINNDGSVGWNIGFAINASAIHAAGYSLFVPGMRVVDNGHIWGPVATAGAAPTPSACGTGCSLLGGSSDTRGVIDIGTGGVTSALLTFGKPFSLGIGQAICTLSPNANLTLWQTSVSSTSITINSSADMSGDHITYMCLQ